jgi:D-lactate dehydrogenase
MRIAVFSTKSYDRASLDEANGRHGHDLAYFTPRLTKETTALAAGCEAVCVFVQDELNHDVLAALSRGGTRLVALRCAGFNNVDLAAAAGLGIRVVRVPAYSPYAVAEHAAALVLTLNRKVHRAYNRVREGNFALEGLLGYDLFRRTVGIVGTGQIGTVFARIMAGFGCRLVGFDQRPNPACQELGLRYVPLAELFAESDIVSLHCPLTPQTRRMIDAEALGRMRPGVTLINTSRGGVLDTRAVIEGLKSGRIGALGLDVYEEEAEVFFEDLSDRVLQDDVLARLLTFPNVIVTGHQGFFTREAIGAIAETTLANVTAIARGELCPNEVKADRTHG